MAESYPYIISNNKIEPILAKIRSAAKPERFSTREALLKWGFSASNDRAMVGVLKALGFLNDNGNPTAFYDRLRDPTDWQYVLGERIRELYSELYAIDTQIHRANETEIKGAISRVTGQDDEAVKRYFLTFKTLASLAKFEPKSSKASDAPKQESEGHSEKVTKESARGQGEIPAFHYNIQIHLPVTTDIAVYNAIFRSLREQLGVE